MVGLFLCWSIPDLESLNDIFVDISSMTIFKACHTSSSIQLILGISNIIIHNIIIRLIYIWLWFKSICTDFQWIPYHLRYLGNSFRKRNFFYLCTKVNTFPPVPHTKHLKICLSVEIDKLGS